MHPRPHLCPHVAILRKQLELRTNRYLIWKEVRKRKCTWITRYPVFWSIITGLSFNRDFSQKGLSLWTPRFINPFIFSPFITPPLYRSLIRTFIIQEDCVRDNWIRRGELFKIWKTFLLRWDLIAKYYRKLIIATNSALLCPVFNHSTFIHSLLVSFASNRNCLNSLMRSDLIPDERLIFLGLWLLSHVREILSLEILRYYA